MWSDTVLAGALWASASLGQPGLIPPKGCHYISVINTILGNQYYLLALQYPSRMVNVPLRQDGQNSLVHRFEISHDNSS